MKFRWTERRVRHYHQVCATKQKHRARPTAEAHARRLFRAVGDVWGVYPCPYGPHWHVERATDATEQSGLERSADKR